MREIKFRAWREKDRTMLYSGQESEYDSLVFWTQGDWSMFTGFFREGLEIMQYTGLKDKNGKEIYECDVVEVEGGVGVIEWDEHDLAWDLRGAYMPITRSGSPKVIGNIYENPELLT